MSADAGSSGGVGTLGEWFIAGDQPDEYAVEPVQDRWHDLPVTNFGSRVESPHGFGTLMCTVPPAPFKPAGCRLTAWLRTVDVVGWVGLWARVDGPEKILPGGRMLSLAFDNMGDRPITGTTDWQQYEVVLDVPDEAVGIAYGVLLSGSGLVGIAGVRLTVAPPGLRRTGAASGG